ncbi:hypothetical protein GCM10007304_47530 [Rhodococcoides trifolii]|uniref:DUF218 domain-containing protein n=2 Tax=Rhodococcoides trifolii TaxID=908250 RepID=A0A917LIV2_9NOCA|nr:hypothetical protein GCM10007304_47530 [Rhodococcus trifolii]
MRAHFAMTEPTADKPKKKRRVLRVFKIVTLTLVVAMVAFIGIGWSAYVDPDEDSVQKADAIFVLGGSHDGREEFALSLAEQGYAPQVVFSNPYEDGHYARYGFEKDGYMDRLCNGDYTFVVSCFNPEPATTRGEGRELARRASAEGWKKVIVVTFTPHIARARFVIDKCWPGEILYVASPTELNTVGWAWNFVYQSGGFVRALFEDC